MMFYIFSSREKEQTAKSGKGKGGKGRRQRKAMTAEESITSIMNRMKNQR
jgi:hypothetical protein